MKNLCTTFVLCLISVFYAEAQKKSISVNDIFKGTFKEEYLQKIISFPDGKSYLKLSDKGTCIEKYSFSTQKQTEILVCKNQLPESFQIQEFQVDNLGENLLLGSNLESVYRRSFLGNYSVFNIKTKNVEPLFHKKVLSPLFSPVANKIAFSFDNNLYIKDLETNTVKQITFDGLENKIINGTSDWVYEEEFEIVRLFEWSPDGNYIAFIRFDQQDVPEFSMDVYGKTLYPTRQVFKYPKAGENNSKVSVWLYNVNTSKCENITPENAYYIPRLQWTNHAEILSFQVLNRKQNKLQLYFYNTKSKQLQNILNEEDAAYVKVSPKIEFLNDNSFLWLSQIKQYNHIFRYDFKGNLINQVTSGAWEVTQLYGADSKNIYYQSTEVSPIERNIYSISKYGTHKKNLTPSKGTHNAYFNTDFSYFIDEFSNAQTPTQYTLYKTKNSKAIKLLVNNDALITKLKSYKTAEKTFSSIEINGNLLNMYMIKPSGFNPNKKYPLLMFQYSGPGSQSVKNKWNNSNDYWHMMLSDLGYIIVCVDGRGTGFMGRDFEKVTQYHLGKYETEDQISVAHKLSELPYIDKNRIGIWGWSFGGFLSTSALLKGNDIFKMAIAVAPVTNWRFYDSVYTERYMGIPSENPEGYDQNSPLFFSDRLKGKYLLIHGSADDNVHVQNAMRMIEALIQNNKDFQWYIYPDKNHGIYGGNTRIYLYHQMTDFILNHL